MILRPILKIKNKINADSIRGFLAGRYVMGWLAEKAGVLYLRASHAEKISCSSLLAQRIGVLKPKIGRC
jgi:hypothetical protein